MVLIIDGMNVDEVDNRVPTEEELDNWNIMTCDRCEHDFDMTVYRTCPNCGKSYEWV